VDIVAKGVPHYFKDGKEHKGGMHKMPNGQLHSGKTHTKSSKRLFHLDELSKVVQKKVKGKKSGTQKKSKKS
jgi:hypothetical protein